MSRPIQLLKSSLLVDSVFRIIQENELPKQFTRG